MSPSHAGGDPVGLKPWITKTIFLAVLRYWDAVTLFSMSRSEQFGFSFVYSSSWTLSSVPDKALPILRSVNSGHFSSLSEKDENVRQLFDEPDHLKYHLFSFLSSVFH